MSETQTAGLYEIINPSDAYTFRACSDEVAAMSVLILGNGAYAVTKQDRTDVLPILMFGSEEHTNSVLTKLFGTTEITPWVEAHAAEMADALESVMSFGFGERLAYDEALAAIDDPAKREAYRDKIHDAQRTSMNNIGAKAWRLAAGLRKK